MALTSCKQKACRLELATMGKYSMYFDQMFVVEYFHQDLLSNIILVPAGPVQLQLFSTVISPVAAV